MSLFKRNPKKFFTQSNLHQTSSFIDLLNKFSEDGYFQCFQCLKKYQGKSTLKRHLQYECGKKGEFKCNLCEPIKKTFKRKDTLQRHLSTYHWDYNQYKI